MSPSIYIMRHGQAEQSFGVADVDRQITREGGAELQRVAAALMRMHTQVDRIVTSPLRRTMQTAELMAAGLGVADPLDVRPELGPGASSTQGMLDAIAETFLIGPKPSRVLVVGHMPDVSQLVGALVTGTACHPIDFSPATMVKIACIGGLRPGSGGLVWALKPDMMELLCVGKAEDTR